MTPQDHESRESSTGRADPSSTAPESDLRPFVIRVTVVAGVAALLFLAWQGRQALLLIFAAVVTAAIFDAAARPFRVWAGFPRRWALLSGLLVIATALGLVGVLVGAQVKEQFAELVAALREAEPTIRGWLDPEAGGSGGGEGSGDGGGSGDGVQGSVATYVNWAMSATSWGLGAFGALGSVALVIVAGYFLASEPALYRHGAAMLFPIDQHQRAEDALEQVGAGLHGWLRGQLVSMTLVGILVGVGTLIIGLPAPLALGLFAGLAAFVPVIGGIAGAAPALLLAGTESGSILLWTAALILAVQQVESNMIMPLVGRWSVQVPPALLLLNVFLFGSLFGGVGVIVAAPLTVAAFVLVKKLYVVGVLEREIAPPSR